MKKLIQECRYVKGIYGVTADHRNAEDMVKRDKKGQPLHDENSNIQILLTHFKGVPEFHFFLYMVNAYNSVCCLRFNFLPQVPIGVGGPGLVPGLDLVGCS